MLAWGNRHFAPEGASVVIVDAATGIPADPILVDRASGRPLIAPDYRLAPGPAAAQGMRRRLTSRTRSALLAKSARTQPSRKRAPRAGLRPS